MDLRNLTHMKLSFAFNRPTNQSRESPTTAGAGVEFVLGSSDETIDRVRAQQVELLFKNVGPAVAGASLTNLVLEAVLVRLHVIDATTGVIWCGYIVVCMIAHLTLLYLYRIAKFDETRWRSWAFAFSAVAFSEGLGWGWAPVFLAVSGQPEIRLLVTCITLIVATAAVPAFGSYLPAFFALFIPAVVPFALSAPFSADVSIQIAALIMPIYLLTVPSLAIQASRKFKELVVLRVKSGALAEHLRSQIELVEQAMIAKSNFLAAASHDLRQPVHAIALFVGALREMRLPEAGERLTQQIESSVEALDSLFGALLDISRLDAHSVEVRKSTFAIGALLERICQDFTAEAAAKSVEIRLAPCQARVHSDPLLLERVLRNIVSNAVRYTDHGRVLVGCRRRGTEIEIQVWDTGPGIAPEHRELIFKEYFQLHNPERDRHKGLGLGLAIVQRLVSLLECDLSLKSELGQGSRFSLKAPLALAHEPAAPSEGRVGPFARESGLIAIIDDEAPILTGMSTLLEGWGYTVISGESSDEVVAKLATCPLRPDLVISDHWLREGQTGFDVIERLRSEYNEEIPAMLISGDTSPELRTEAAAAGALLLHKPTPNGKLRAAISSSLAASRRAAGEFRDLGAA